MQFDLPLIYPNAAIAFGQYLDAIEAQSFVAIAQRKQVYWDYKRSVFLKSGIRRLVLLGPPGNLWEAPDTLDGLTVEKLDADQLRSQLKADAEGVRLAFAGSCFVLTNNVLAKITPSGFIELYKRLPESLFLAHDYDNHHWFEMSAQCALLCDLYAPGHINDYTLASRLGARILAGIPIGSVQWSDAFVAAHRNEIFSMPRAIGPLGKHHPYPKFRFRNQVIARLQSDWPDVGFVNAGAFHVKTAQERWAEWVGHHFHLIAPVSSDVPIRFFDALLTGGVPLVPVALKASLDSYGVPDRFYATYGMNDLAQPKDFLTRLSQRYPLSDVASRMLRHDYAMQHYQLSATLRKMIHKTYVALSTP